MPPASGRHPQWSIATCSPSESATGKQSATMTSSPMPGVARDVAVELLQIAAAGIGVAGVGRLPVQSRMSAPCTCQPMVIRSAAMPA